MKILAKTYLIFAYFKTERGKGIYSYVGDICSLKNKFEIISIL